MINEKIQLTEEVIKGILRGQVTPEEFVIALNNVFVHGDILEETDVEFIDESLGQLYKGIDLMRKAAERMH